jgi:hypothetical protein
MALNAKIIKASGGLVIPVVSADPGSPADGAIWYNSTTDVFKFRENGVTRTLGDAEVAALGVSFDNTTLTGDDRFTADNVQAAISEVMDAVEAHVADTTDAHDAASIGYSGTADALDVAAALDEIDGHADALIALSGVAEGAEDLGTFTGSTIPDSQTVKQALQALETEVEAKADDSVVDNLVTLSGVAENATNLGTFTGSTIPDSQTIKQALQALETEVETKAASSVVSEIDQNVDDLISLSGVAENSANLGTFTGSTIPDSQTIKQALQALETEVEAKADDADVIKKDGSVAFTADQSMGGFKLTNLAAPASSTDAVNKGYVDQAIEGLKPKEAVRVATTAPGTLASDFEAGDSVDGVTLVAGDRILLKDQADASENGIYVVQASGAPVRATDFDALTPFDEINGSLVAVQEGTDNAGKIFVQQGVVAEIDTDDIDFVFFNSSSALVGGDGITVSGSNISVDHDGEGLAFVADQLALELDGSTLSKGSSGLKVADAGITGTQLNTSVAGAGLAGGGGSALSVNVDDSTIEIATDTLQVKDGGITNAKIATGIDAAKLADGSVSNTEFQYLANVGSDIQTQLNDKLGSISADPFPSLGAALDLNGQAVYDDTGLRLGESDTGFYLHKYVHAATLTASQSNTALSALTFAHANWGGCEIEYLIKEATTNRIAKGRILVATNGTDVDIIEDKAETGDIGVDWTAAVNGANIEIRYTTTANNKTGRFIQKLLAAI